MVAKFTYIYDACHILTDDRCFTYKITTQTFWFITNWLCSPGSNLQDLRQICQTCLNYVQWHNSSQVWHNGNHLWNIIFMNHNAYLEKKKFFYPGLDLKILPQKIKYDYEDVVVTKVYKFLDFFSYNWILHV